MTAIGMHIAFDPAQPGSEYTAVTIVASDGKGSHATMVAKYLAGDGRTADQMIGLALQEFGERMELAELTWIPEAEDPEQEAHS